MFFTVLFGRFRFALLTLLRFCSLLVLFINRACSHSALLLPLSLSLSHSLSLKSFSFYFPSIYLWLVKIPLPKWIFIYLFFAGVWPMTFPKWCATASVMPLSLFHVLSLSLSYIIIIHALHNAVNRLQNPISNSTQSISLISPNYSRNLFGFLL